jgi:low affinity Fe/Cu permease
LEVADRRLQKTAQWLEPMRRTGVACHGFVGEPCGRLRDSALQWQAVVNTAMNINSLVTASFSKSLYSRRSAHQLTYILSINTNATNFLWTLERHCNYNIHILQNRQLNERVDSLLCTSVNICMLDTLCLEQLS